MLWVGIINSSKFFICFWFYKNSEQAKSTICYSTISGSILKINKKQTTKIRRLYYTFKDTINN